MRILALVLLVGCTDLSLDPSPKLVHARFDPDARVIPMQATEFMCKNCYLVKHRSQLADKRKMLCRDCA